MKRSGLLFGFLFCGKLQTQQLLFFSLSSSSSSSLDESDELELLIAVIFTGFSSSLSDSEELLLELSSSLSLSESLDSLGLVFNILMYSLSFVLSRSAVLIG
jgi:hypothetical protein